MSVPLTPSISKTPSRSPSSSPYLSGTAAASTNGPSASSLTPSRASSHAQALHEISSLLDELTSEYTHNQDELQLILKITANHKHAQQLNKKKTAEMKDVILDMNNYIYNLQKQTLTPPSLPLKQQQVLLNSQKEKINQNIQQLCNEVEKVQVRNMDIDKQKKLLEAQKETTEKQAKAKMPVIAGTMGLYRNFSNIAWDYEAPDNTIKGTFHYERSKKIRPFHFDATALSNVDVADQLWNMMSADE